MFPRAESAVLAKETQSRVSGTKSTSHKRVFCRADLERCADGLMFGADNARLPSGPLLMLDRITDIKGSGGLYDRGYAIAELDIDPANWYFKHHFRNDPVMPGCFSIESLWQLTGFYLAWAGHKGLGRVLDSGRTRFFETIRDGKQTLKISIHVRKIVASSSNTICIADGSIQSSGSTSCNSDSIKIGLFPQ